MKASIIILSYNHSENTTKPCVESIYKNTSNNDFELIIIDNASVDGTGDYLKELEKKYENVKVIYNNANKGYAGGNNDGIKIAKGDFIVLLNNDTLVSSGWLESLFSPFFQDDSIGLVGPVSNSVGNEQKIMIENITEENFENISREYTDKNKNYYFKTKRLGFFCVAIRKEVVDKIGLLDEIYGIGMFEDDDFCLRAINAGYKLAVSEGCFVYHKGSFSFNKYFDTDAYIRNFNKNRNIFIEKWGKEWTFSSNLIAYLEKLYSDISEILKNGSGGESQRIYLRKKDVLENAYFLENKEIENINKIKILELKEAEFQNKFELEIAELQREIDFMASSKFWKFRNAWMATKESLKEFIFSLKGVVIKIRSIISPLYHLTYAQIYYLKMKQEKGGGKKDISIAFQLDSFDKGGLEEVVYSLLKKIKDKDLYNPYVFINDNKLGYLGEKIAKEGFNVILLHRNKFFLDKAVKRLQINLVNLHYSVFGADIYEKNNIPVIYTIHNNYIWADDKFINQRVELYEKFKKFIAVSGQVRTFFSDRFKIEKDKIVAVPNGLNIEAMTKIINVVDRNDFGLKKDDFVFINISSFNWNKFHILMVVAMKEMIKKYPNFKMLFVGNILDKNCYNFIKDEIKKNGLSESMKIMDYVPKDNVLGLMKMSDCFILPSLIEGWSIAVMEAMYCELPLILSDIGSARNVIENGDIGIIIKNPYQDVQKIDPNIFSKLYTNSNHLDNMDSLCSAMEDMYLNSEAWKIKAKKGKKKIEENFNAERMASVYVEEFNKILEKRYE